MSTALLTSTPISDQVPELRYAQFGLPVLAVGTPATAEAVSWGKIDPEPLPDAVSAYVDSTIALPFLAACVTARCKPREPRRLVRKLPSLMDRLRAEYRTTDLYKKYWG